MIILVVLNSIVIASAVLITRCFFSIKKWNDCLLVGFIVFFAQIVFSELILGVLGALYVQSLLLVNFLILLLIFWANRQREPYPISKPELGRLLDSKLLLFAISVFFAFFLIKSSLNLINPPMSADSLQYHLAFPATWIKNAKLDNPFCPFGAIFNPVQTPIEGSGISYFPINAELFFLWLMMPLKNAFLADLGEVPFYLIGMIAIYSILRRYSVDTKRAVLSGLLWVLIPNIFKQLKTASQIDVMCAVMLLLVLYSLLLFKEEPDLRYAILVGISIGIFIGTKYINLVWMAGLSPIIFYLLFKDIRTNKIGLRKIIILLGVIILMVVLFGGFMYIKNFLFIGNPFFPAQIRLLGKTVFQGLVDKGAYIAKHASGDTFSLKRICFKEGLGVQFLTIILPGIFLPMVFTSFLKRRIQHYSEYFVIFITPLIMLILYNTFLNVYVVRYLFPLLSIGFLTSVIFITRFSRGNKYLDIVGFIAIFASATELAHRNELIFSLLLSFLFYIMLVSYRKKIFKFYHSKSFSRWILALLIIFIILLTLLNNKYDKEESRRCTLGFSKKESWQVDIGKSWQWLNENTGRGANVAYAGRQEFYPLFGTKLKNNVRYISINEREPDPYNKPDGLLRAKKDYHAWRNNLKKNNIEYLFIALPFFENREVDDPSKFTIEDEWALGHPEEFELLYSNSLARIYKIKIKG